MKKREPYLCRFAALPFAGRLAFRQMLAFIRGPSRLERIFDEIVCDAGTLEIQPVRNSLGFGEGKVADGRISANFIRDIGRHRVAR